MWDMDQGGYKTLPEGWYCYDEEPSTFDPMVAVWAKGKEYPPTKKEHYKLNPRVPYRMPTNRELATGRTHNLYTLDEGLIGLAPYPI